MFEKIFSLKCRYNKKLYVILHDNTLLCAVKSLI